MAGNELLGYLEEAQRQLEQKVQLGIRKREAWELKFHEQHEQITGILDSIQILLNTHKKSQSHGTPKSQNPTPKSPDINLSVASSTPPHSTSTAKQFSTSQTQQNPQVVRTSAQIDIPLDEIKTDFPSLNTQSLLLHENSEAANAQDMFDEMLRESKSTKVDTKGSKLIETYEVSDQHQASLGNKLWKSEAESISENPSRGSNVDDVVVIREIVKDRGKREANMPTNFMLKNFVAESEARKMEPIIENSTEGLKNDDKMLVEREFVKDRGRREVIQKRGRWSNNGDLAETYPSLVLPFFSEIDQLKTAQLDGKSTETTNYVYYTVGGDLARFSISIEIPKPTSANKAFKWAD